MRKLAIFALMVAFVLGMSSMAMAGTYGDNVDATVNVLNHATCCFDGELDLEFQPTGSSTTGDEIGWTFKTNFDGATVTWDFGKFLDEDNEEVERLNAAISYAITGDWTESGINPGDEVIFDGTDTDYLGTSRIGELEMALSHNTFYASSSWQSVPADEYTANINITIDDQS